ncbi:MAG TPA: molybdopterin-dependent oxidoreductase, partial [Solirubrobacteraceae bacterium]|nr:molybdopterin-dependent oxidoreductase [Solirubrobacteraceae bacterium]
MSATGQRTAYRTCPLCEATCGLELTLEGDRVVSIRGDAQDVFSHGFVCPKGAALRQLHEDPDCITTPLIRDGDGFRPASWDEAFALIDERLSPILAADRNAVAVYLGNPTIHNLSGSLYGKVLLRALATRNVFTASTVDQMPKQLACGLMFGTGTTVPVPDIDRTAYLLMLGANPLASNGSLMTAPDMRGRLRALRARGGKLVVIDPRRTRTAAEADEHHFIRPGTDAQLLFAIVHVLFADGLADPGERLRAMTAGLDEVRALSEPFTPEAAAAVCGIPAEEIRRIAHDLAAAPRAAVYGRIGTCTQEFGTLASWLVDVLNLLTGNLDREGGAMFPLAAAGHSNAAGAPGRGRGTRLGRFTSRVRGLPEVFGELPVACLAEEIDTPGEGQVRALITLAGNPARSTPNSGRLTAALDSLEFMVSLDVYVNET